MSNKVYVGNRHGKKIHPFLKNLHVHQDSDFSAISSAVKNVTSLSFFLSAFSVFLPCPALSLSQ